MTPTYGLSVLGRARVTPLGSIYAGSAAGGDRKPGAESEVRRPIPEVFRRWFWFASESDCKRTQLNSIPATMRTVCLRVLIQPTVFWRRSLCRGTHAGRVTRYRETAGASAQDPCWLCRAVVILRADVVANFRLRSPEGPT